MTLMSSIATGIYTCLLNSGKQYTYLKSIGVLQIPAFNLSDINQFQKHSYRLYKNYISCLQFVSTNVQKTLNFNSAIPVQILREIQRKCRLSTSTPKNFKITRFPQNMFVHRTQTNHHPEAIFINTCPSPLFPLAKTLWICACHVSNIGKNLIK